MRTGPHPLQERISEALAAARERLGIEEGPLRLTVACSGGTDSRALLHLLVEVQGYENLELIVCHVDHRLRPTSGRDACFVESLAASYGLPFALYTAPDLPERENLESWARGVRYAFLERCRTERNADLIVTAHHERDQAETLLMRLLSGRLLTDARSIAVISERRRLLRPLLAVPHAEIVAYLRERRLESVEDETNNDLSRMRNRVRHQLLPFLEQNYNPRFAADAAALATRLGEDEDELWSLARGAAESLGESCDVTHLLGFSDALRWRVIALSAERQVGEDARKLGYHTLRRIADELWTLPPSDIGFGISVRIDESGGAMVLRFSRGSAGPPPQQLDPAPLAVPGEVCRNYAGSDRACIGAEVLSTTKPQSFIERAISETGDPHREAAAYFDGAALALDSSALLVREWSAGDLVRVWGRGRRKLKKLYQEQGVTLTLRRTLPIVQLGDAILWVPGVARSDIAPVHDGTRRIVRLYYRRVSGPQ